MPAGTPADYEWIMDRLSEGKMSRKEIAEGANITVDSLRRIVARLTGVKGKKNLPLSPEKLERAKMFLEDGAGYRETAATLGCDEKTLARHFPNMGLSKAESLERALMGRYMPMI